MLFKTVFTCSLNNKVWQLIPLKNGSIVDTDTNPHTDLMLMTHLIHAIYCWYAVKHTRYSLGPGGQISVFTNVTETCKTAF